MDPNGHILSILSRLTSCTLILFLGLSLSACDSSEDDSDSSSSDSGSDSGSDACDPDVAATMCDPNCAFEPADIDCMNACQNIADQCASDACSASDECVGQNQDVATCMLGCEGTKLLGCTKVVFGCWDTAGGTSNCEDVGSCVGAN